MPKWIDECVEQVLGLLRAAEPDRYERDDHETAELITAMAAHAAKVVELLERQGERIAAADRPLLVATTLSRAARAEVYSDRSRAAERFVELRARRRRYPDLDLSLLVRTKDLTDEEFGRFTAAADVVNALEGVEVNRVWLTMVASAVADPVVDTETNAATVLDLVNRAHAEAVRFVASRPDLTVIRRAFMELGNPVFFAETAAMRAAIDRPCDGLSQPTDHTELGVLLEELVALSRAYINDHRHVWWDGGGQDGVRAFFAHARFLGGKADGVRTERIFRTLHPTINGLVLRKAPRPKPRTVAIAAVTLTNATASHQEGLGGESGLVEHMVSWAMAELYAGVETDAHRSQLRQWIVERNENEKLTADMLMFRLDRLRRLVDRFHALPDVPPVPGVPDVGGELTEVREKLTKLITEVVSNGQDSRAVPDVVLPPLWRTRAASVTAVGRKLYAETGRRAVHVAARAKLAAGLAVRAPFQFCVRTEVAGRTGPCDCGARVRGGSARIAVRPSSVCPHRTWEDPGLVENYATLGQLAEMTPDAVRAALVDYSGPGADWVRTAFDR